MSAAGFHCGVMRASCAWVFSAALLYPVLVGGEEKKSGSAAAMESDAAAEREKQSKDDNSTYSSTEHAHKGSEEYDKDAQDSSAAAEAGKGEYYKDADANAPSDQDYSKGETKTCKTRKPYTQTDAGREGHTGQYRTTTRSYEYFTRKCDGTVCLKEEGEEVARECGKDEDEFVENTSVMWMYKEAGKDMYCSSGVKNFVMCEDSCSR